MNVGSLFAELGLDMSAFSASLSQAQAQLNSVGNKMKDIGQKMSLAISAPILALGGAMVKSAIDIQASQGKIQASLGVTEEEAKKLSGTAQEVWKNGFGESLEEVNQNLIITKQNIQGINDTDLQKVTQGAMTISELFGEDINATTAAASVMMKNFGIEGQEALDLITIGFQKGGNYSGELMDTLREYAPQFASMGFSAQSAMELLISGANAGAFNLDKVGDSVKEFNLRAQDGSKGTIEAFTAIGLNAEQMGADIAGGGEKAQSAFMATIASLSAMKDPMEQNAAGVALFGTQWEDVRSKVITAMAEGQGSLEGFKGATDEATQAMQNNNPGLALQKAMREMQVAIAPALMPLVDMFNNNVVPAVKSVADWFGKLSPEGQKIAVAVAGIVAAIGPLLVIFGTMASAISALIPLFTAVGTAIGAISLPVVAVVAVIGTLIAAGIALYKNWDEIKNYAKELVDSIIKSWENVKNSTIAIWESIKTFITDAFKWLYDHNHYFHDLVDSISEAWNNAKNITTEVWTAISSWLSGLWTNIKSEVSNSWNSIYTTISGIWNKIKEGFNQLVQSAFNWGKNLMNEFIDGFKSMFSSLTKTLGDAADSVADFLGFHSPTKKGAGKDADKWAPNFVNMFADGITANIPKLQNVSSNMADVINPSYAGTNNYSTTGNVFNINITGSNGEEIWEHLERKLGRLGVVV